MVRGALTFLVVMLWLARGPAEAPKVVTALKGLDPVALAGGKEIAGKDGLAAEHGRHRYLFATPENKAAFEKNPGEFAVQFGGACGRMGPLSGAGNPDRFHVFDKRIYMFASDACLNSFKLAPELHVERPDDPPKGSAAEIRRGKELVELALIGLGGAKAVDAVHTYRVEIELSYPQKDKTPFLMKKVVSIEFPGKFREEDSYPGWSGANVATGDGGFQTSGKLAWPMAPDVRDYFLRQCHRHPLPILKARAEKDFVAVAGGKTKVAGVEVEELIVGHHGATTTLYVEPKTGRVLQSTFRDRTTGPIGEVTRTYTDFRAAGDLTVPYSVATSFNGQPTTVPARKTESISVNPKLDAALFQKPD